MMEQQIKVFKKILKVLIKELEEIKEIEIADFKDAVLDAFEGYNYEGEEEVIGFENWEDLSKDGSYELKVKIDHEDAYELTLFTTIKDGKITIYNVL
jgi:hypothetical protein